ncbi:MAG: hypothetical protein C0490_18360, partial [Marivirga sp.]|nr:hypothetical protein [Marivirga sp.]
MLRKWKLRNYLIKVIKITGWVALSIVALVLLIALAIQIPFIQNKLTQKAVTFLEGKIGTNVSLQHISLSFPKRLVLKGIYLEDQARDTLFSAGELSINTNLWGLFRNQIKLDDIRLDNLRAYINRSPQDSTFNFQYIVNAFAGDSTSTTDTTQAPWKFSLGTIELTHAHLGYKDSLEENFADVRLATLELEIDEFDLDNSRFKLGSFNLENVKANVSQRKLKEDTIRADVPADPGALSIDFDFKEITLHSIEAEYNNMRTGQVFYLNLGDLALSSEKIDLNKHEIRLDEISLANTFISLQQTSPPSKQDISEGNRVDTIQFQQKNWAV